MFIANFRHTQDHTTADLREVQMPSLSDEEPFLFIGAPPGSGKTTLIQSLMASMSPICKCEVKFEADDQTAHPKLAALRKFLQLLQECHPGESVLHDDASPTVLTSFVITRLCSLLRDGTPAAKLNDIWRQAGLVPLKQKSLQGNAAEAFRAKLVIRQAILPVHVFWYKQFLILVLGIYNDQIFAGTDKMDIAFKTSGNAAACAGILMRRLQRQVPFLVRMVVEGNDIVTHRSIEVLGRQGLGVVNFLMTAQPLVVLMRDYARRQEGSLGEWLRRLSGTFGHHASCERIFKTIHALRRGHQKIYINEGSVGDVTAFLLEKL